MKLPLEAKNKGQRLILAFLEEHASETLAEKIKEGVQINKDGMMLIQRKDLDGFMRYAQNRAREEAEKGASYACVEDTDVFGWAIHYFEEDEIEGTLYNIDGSPYVPEKKGAKKTATTRTPKAETKPAAVAQTNEACGQESLFDLFDIPLPTINTEDEEEPEIQATETVEETAEEVRAEPVEMPVEEDKTEPEEAVVEEQAPVEEETQTEPVVIVDENTGEVQESKLLHPQQKEHPRVAERILRPIFGDDLEVRIEIL